LIAEGCDELGSAGGRPRLGGAGAAWSAAYRADLDADSGVPLYVLQRVAGHQDPAVTRRYLHPNTAALAEAGSVFGLVGAKWGQVAGADTETGGSTGEGIGV
jgi:hypothetical protein